MVNWALWRWGIGVQRLSALAPHPRAMLSPFQAPQEEQQEMVGKEGGGKKQGWGLVGSASV